MKTLKALVRNGRLVVDEPTSLPEGTHLNLAIADDWDDLDDEERRALDEAISEGWASLRAGRRIPAADVIRGLRAPG
jgi:hypothetical protein